jgi:hypothetical protein
MTDYNVKFTDKTKQPITISETNVNVNDTDLVLFGRKKLEYGSDMNANFLHLLENFSSEENPLLPGTPDVSKTSLKGGTDVRLLSHPINGQLWYNSTQETLFVFNGASWVALGMIGDISANWGIISDGSQIPRPTNQYGYTFEYSECSWIVSPFVISSGFNYMQCTTDENAVVTMNYIPDGTTTPVSGCANYLIVGIKGNINQGQLIPLPSATPPPSVTPTPSVTRTTTPVVSPTQSVTPTPGVSATATPNPSLSPTPAATVTPTPSQLVYLLSVSSTPSGNILPGASVCYNVNLNYPAPAGGYPFVLTRSGDFSSVCASTDGTVVGNVIDTTNGTIPAGQMSTQICKNAPMPVTPTPTPTATPRRACIDTTITDSVVGGSGATYLHGFMFYKTDGTPMILVKNSNATPCSAYSACKTATSFSTTITTNVASQYFSVPPYGTGYNGVPALHFYKRVKIDGIGYVDMSLDIPSTTPQTFTQVFSISNRLFTLNIHFNPTLISQAGTIQTWKMDSDWNIIDNETGQQLGFC